MENSCYVEEPVKMLIVDDEPLIREGMKQILDWDGLGIEIIGDAENGFIAMEIAGENKPDLVLADIRMPGMNGLELICRLKDIVPDALYVIVSGYDDFEYAKKAVSLGVSRYVVKPIQVDELRAVTEECLGKIYRRRLRKKQNMVLNSRLVQALPILRDNFLLNLLNGNTYDVNVDEKLEELGIALFKKFHTIICIKIFTNSPADKVDNKKLVILKKRMDESLKDINAEGCDYYGLINNNDLVYILSFDRDEGYKKIIARIFKELDHKMEKYYECSLQCGVGSIRKSADGLSTAYHEGLKCLEYKVLNNGSNINFFDELPHGLIQRSKKKLIEDIKGYVLENADTEINLTDIASRLYYNPSYVSRIFKEEMNKNFSEFAMEVKIKHAKELMDNTDLKLYTICEKVGYKDYKYFSTLFKKITGMSPNDYKNQGSQYDIGF
ncbi:MAG: response regulator [Actinobacteria bacterium]|nr:response regulator [Actinomycetota bacterium]